MNNNLTIDNTFLISPDKEEVFKTAIKDFNSCNNTACGTNLLRSDDKGLLYEVTGASGVNSLMLVLGISERLNVN